MKKLLSVFVILLAVSVTGCENLFQLSGPAGQLEADVTAADEQPAPNGQGPGSEEPVVFSVGFAVSLPDDYAADTADTSAGSFSTRGLTVAFVSVTAQRTGYGDISGQLVYDVSTNTATGELAGLAEGEWLFIAEATDSDGTLLYSGQVTHTVSTGANNVAIDVFEEIGAVKIIAGWSLAGGFRDLSITASRNTFPSVQTVKAVSQTVTSAEAYVLNLTAGDWMVTVQGIDGSTAYFEASEIVTIETNVVAERTIGIDQIKATGVAMEPAGGTYNTTQEVFLSTITEGATIKYATGSGDPEYGSTYTPGTPVTISADTTLNAVAIKDGLENSSVTTEEYDIQVAPPTFTPVSGTYTEGQSVEIATTTEGATIRYTTGGSTQPSESSGTYYTPGSAITVNDDTTIMAIAYKSGCTASAVVTGNYVITGTVDAPVFDPPAGTYASEQQVSITSATEGASIRYTLDGVTDPTPTTGTLYDNNPITVGTDVTLKAIAYKQDWADSSVTSAEYTLDLTYTTLDSTDPISGVLTGFNQMSLANSPYHIGGNVLVEEGSILKIEPGVTVIFDSHYYWQVDGVLIAEGTEADRIVFTSAAQSGKSQWNMLDVNSVMSKFSYCDFTCASTPFFLDGGLNGNFTLQHCTISTCHTGIETEWDYNGDISLQFCDISNCDYGLDLNSENITITDCTVSNCTEKGIQIGGQTSALIERCTVEDCNYGFYTGGVEDLVISDSLFQGCLNRNVYISNPGHPITIIGCTIRNTGSIGLHIYGSGAGSVVEGCNFYDNGNALYTGNYGDLTVANCNITDDVSVGSLEGTYTMNFSNNYWGTTDTAVIDDRIHDYYDDFTLPEITYEPILTEAVVDAGYSGDTYVPPLSNTTILSDYLTGFAHIANKISLLDPVADDEDPDPNITQYTIPGDISGNCVVITTIDTVTGASTAVYDFDDYNDTGIIYTSPAGEELTLDLDGSVNGSFTGTINMTGDETGYITYDLTYTEGVPSGTYDVNGEIFNYEDL